MGAGHLRGMSGCCWQGEAAAACTEARHQPQRTPAALKLFKLHCDPAAAAAVAAHRRLLSCSACRRREAVKAAMLHAWRGYEQYAWGHDELCPLTKSGKNSFGGLGATIVDSLDTLHMMGALCPLCLLCRLTPWAVACTIKLGCYSMSTAPVLAGCLHMAAPPASVLLGKTWAPAGSSLRVGFAWL